MTEQTKFDLKNIKCADGQQIRIGSVLRKIETGEVGVVTDIKKPGDMGAFFERVGDVVVSHGPGHSTVTSAYTSWKHVPHQQQTYSQRLRSWLKTYSEYEKDEDMAVDGILSLIDKNVIESEWDHPCTLSDALHLMSKHLEQLSGQASR